MFHFACSLRVVPLLAIAACSLVTSAGGQEASGAPESENELPVKNMVLVPCAEPDPPLQRLLIPAFADLQPGNAATSYYRAITLLPRDQKLQFGETQESWLDVPLREFPQDEARKWLAAYQSVLQETRTATLRESCDWNHRVRELQGMAPLAFLLPEMHETRTIARVLRIQARLELAEGRFDEALATITMGYRLAENVAQSPILISGLVGIAIAQTMNACVLDWIESGGPNLYWALASLPNPLVDIRPALQQEMHLPLQVFPFLKDPEQAVHTPEQWRAIIAESVQRIASVSDSPNSSTLSNNLAAQAMATGLILAGYPSAKQQLIDSGMDAAQVEAMPVGQVVAIQSARAYRKVYQETMKWTLLPYWQSHRQMRASFANLQTQGFFGKSGGLPGVIQIAAIMLPAIEPATFAPVRLQREIAALQTIEALRMAAARTGGQFPQTLEELQSWPVPVDPLTGRLIEYQLDDGVAVLTLPPPDGMPADSCGKRYKLSLKSAQK
jgi:hypothetical protein